MLSKSWQKILQEEFHKPYFKNLESFLNSEFEVQPNIFPVVENIFSSLNAVDFEDVKVVILGQDPYHGHGQATGFSFGVPPGCKLPPSLRNIFKEVSADLNIIPPQNSSLLGWAKQGVLLLNTILTVRESVAFSHRNKGWEVFTDKIIEKLGKRENPAVFLLWGSPSQQKGKLIEKSHHLILNASHPSPLSSYRGFFGCKHFSKTNDFLKNFSCEINWSNS